MVIVTPKRHILGSFRVFWAFMRSNRSTGLARRRSREKKEKKSHKEHIWPYFTRPCRRNRLFDLEQIWLFGRAPVPYHTCQFLPRSIKNCCVALHESLPSFRFSALHRLSPLTQLGPAGPLVIISTMHTINTHTTSHFRLEASRKLLRCCGVDADFFRGIQ